MIGDNFVNEFLDKKEVIFMETLTGATWFWLLVPMPVTVVLSLISLFLERGESK